jgi:hypothetical protein
MTKSNFLTVTMKTLNRKFIVALCGGVMCISSFVAYAALDTKNIPEVKRTPQALYLSAEDAYALRSSSQNVAKTSCSSTCGAVRKPCTSACHQPRTR